MASLSNSCFNTEITEDTQRTQRIFVASVRTATATRLLIAVFILVFAHLAQAQTFPLQIQVNVMPPYSAYLQDYPGTGQQVRVLIINTSRTTYQIRLTGQLTGDNGIEIRTSPNYRPPRPVTVPPGQTLLTRNDLEGLFDLNQVEVTGIDKNVLARGFPLPDGTYQLCVRAYNETATNTAAVAFGQPLSAEFPIGCSAPLTIRSVEPPILIAPLCDSDVLPTTPQATVFTWTPPAGVSPATVEYVLRIVELPQVNIDPNVYIDAVVLPKSGVEVRGLRTSTFLYGPTQPPLIVGKRYAWRVQAIDRARKLNFLNDGKSPVCAFRYGVSDTMTVAAPIEPQLVIVHPPAASGRKLPKIPVGLGNLFKMSWHPEPTLTAKVAKAFELSSGSVDKQSAKTLTDQLSALSYSVHIYERASNKLVLNRQVKTEYLELEKTDLPTAMVTGKDYRAEVSLLGFTPVQLKKMGFPENQPIAARARLFTLVAEDKGDPTDSLTIQGTLVFRYPGETGEGHVLPNTKIQLEKIFPNQYRGFAAYGQTDASGNYSIRLLRSVLHGSDTTQTQTRCLIQVANPFIQNMDDAGYYQTSTEGTFLINRSQTGVFNVEGITFLASAYRLAVTVRQAYKNWPGAPDVKLEGKQLVLYRKPGQTDYDKLRLPGEAQTSAGPSSSSSSGSKNNSGGALASGSNFYNPAPQIKLSNNAVNTIGMSNQQAVEKAGFIYLGTATIQTDGTVFTARFDNLVYSLFSSDRYSIYCPDCDQQPQDAESFAFTIPKDKLPAQPAHVESYTLNIQTTEAPTATFKGQLNYKFADSGKDGAQVKPLGNTQVHLQVVYRNVNGGKFESGIPDYPELSDFHQDFSPTLATAITAADGSFTFSAKLVKPLPLGTQLQVKAHGSGDVGNMPAAVYVRALRVVVDNPYYASPIETYGDTQGQSVSSSSSPAASSPKTGANTRGQANLYTSSQRAPGQASSNTSGEQVEPQGSYDLGGMTAVVRSYTLNVQVKSDTTGLSKVLVQQAGIQQDLSGVRVSVLRYPKSTFPGPTLGPPIDEGTGTRTTQKFRDSTYTVIATDKSNADGKVSFPRMVMANGNDDAYFVATESSVDGINNYKLVSLKRITVTESWGATYTPYPTAAQKKQAIKLDNVIKGGADVNCKTVWKVRHLVGGLGGSQETDFGPFDPDTKEGADKIKQFQELSAKNTSTDNYDVFPYDQCDKADTYWIGDKLHDSKINNNVLITRDYYGQVYPVFADAYSPFQSDIVERFLAPGQPVVNVRVVDITDPTKGIQGAFVRLSYTDGQGKSQTAYQVTGENGWIPKPFVAVPGTNATLKITADGYVFSGATKEDGGSLGSVTSAQKVIIGSLMLGQNAYYPRMLMQPNTRITGWTVDADAETGGTTKPSVEAYVQVDNGTVEKTWWSPTKKAFRFDVSAPGYKADSLKILPLNISYFNEYRLVKSLPKPVPSNQAGISLIEAGEIPIFQRDHRLTFVLIDKTTKGIISNGTVHLFGRTDPQSTFQPANGEALIKAKFKNVSVENLFVEVSAPGYVTKAQSVTNTESKYDKIQTVFLEAATYVKGVVVVKNADGQETPLPGAEVFVAGGNNIPTPYSTTAGPGGSFTLAVGKQFTDVTIQATYSNSGITVSGNVGVYNKGQNQPSSLQVNVDGQNYIGATEKNYGLPQAPNASLKLALTTFDKYKVTTIWGFPVKVESLTALANNYVQVTGEVDLSISKFGPFAIIDPDMRVRFEKVMFKPSASDPTLGEPTTDKIALKVGVLDNLGYYDKSWKAGQNPIYNIRLTALDAGYSGGNFYIERKQGGNTGVVYAQAQVIDNSFKFSENLFSYEKGQFFLYDPANGGQPGTQPYVVAFDASGTNIKRSDFGLCRKDGNPMTMKLLAFDASSTLDGSRLVGDQIQLNPTLRCTIKDATPSSISVTVGKLILRNNTVDAKSGDTPLTFALAGDWSVEVRNWKLDYQQGGFYATEGVVKTGKVDVPISLFNLRADFFKLEAAPTSTLSLAGLANLTVNGKAFFGFDPATGSDMKGHWSVVVVPDGSGKPAAKLGANSGLPGLTKGLDFETVSLLDNGEDALTFGAGSKSFDFFNGVITVRPKTIETGKDYFAFDAGMSTKIPNAPKDVQMRFIYSRPAGQSAVALKTTLPGEYKIDTKGQITFSAGDEVSADGSQKKAFYFADGVMAIRGMAEEPNKLRLGDPSHNALVLVYSLKNGFTQITHDRKLNLNDPSALLSLTKAQLDDDTWNPQPLAIEMGDKSFQSMYCHQTVTNGNWDLLKFSGIPGGFDGLEPTEENRIAFTAYGEIKAENQKFKPKGINTGNGTIGKDGDKIGMSGVGTPFGKLELVYDMAEKRFTGTLDVPGLAVGEEGMSAVGTAQIRIDPKGFYFVLGGVLKDVPIIVPVDLKGGIMVGWYLSDDIGDAKDILFMYTHHKALPCAFKSGFKGFFTIGEIPIPVVGSYQSELDVPGVGGYKVAMDSYVDGYLFGNYDNGTLNWGSGLGVSSHAYAYGKILVVSASGESYMSGSADAKMTLLKGQADIDLSMNMAAGFAVTLTVDPPGDMFDASVPVSADFCLTLKGHAQYKRGDGFSAKPGVDFKFAKCNDGDSVYSSCTSND